MLLQFTLDQSWLWCETWCSDESLAQAKTIDLCNNPCTPPFLFLTLAEEKTDPLRSTVTHEPKLHRAKRLIPEWTVYVRFPLPSLPIHDTDAS